MEPRTPVGAIRPRRRGPLVATVAGLSLVGVLAWTATTGGGSASGGPDDGDTAPEAPLGDEFDGPGLDTSTWSTCYFWRAEGCTNEWNDELQAYHPVNVGVSDGALQLVAREEPTTGYLADGTEQDFRYSSGMVSGHDGETFRYGFVEARARVPSGQGLWPALWLLAADRVWPPEIDIMEVIGDEPGVVHQTLHADDGTATRFQAEADDYSEDWHTFAIDWRPGSLTFYVDGERTGNTTEGVPDEPMYFLANLAVGGEWPGPPGPDTELPATFSVDHVRIWPGTDGPPAGHPLHEPSP